eukprot:9487742-Pyramimonas_sp.AAC.1
MLRGIVVCTSFTLTPSHSMCGRTTSTNGDWEPSCNLRSALLSSRCLYSDLFSELLSTYPSAALEAETCKHLSSSTTLLTLLS